MAYQGLVELRTAYLRGDRSPVDVVEELIAAEDPPAVWITKVSPEALRARAHELAGRRPEDLPLYGVPFAVKDNIDVAGLPTTAGCPAYAYLPERTAPVVAALLNAGAILVGKTNLDQFATGLTGSRSPYGSGESVFGGGLISGGSSSGSAVAVAAGLVIFSLGTDTAGSGRVPAALNGIVGLKPTRGVLSTEGVVPACRSLDCVSVFARDVPDAVAVFDVLHRGPRRAAIPVDAVRLAVPRLDQLDFDGDRGQAERFASAAAATARLVGGVEPVDLAPFLAAGDLLYTGPWVAERLADLETFIAAHTEDVLPITREIITGGTRYSAADAFRGMHRLAALRATVDELWRRADVLVLPTIPTTFTLDEIAEQPKSHNLTLGRYTQFANLLDLAVLSVPAGTTPDGRPAGVSLIGPAHSEPTLVRLAAALRGETLPGPGADDDDVELAVVGHHLRGETRNGELVAAGGRFARTTRTAECYRLFRLPHGPAGLPGLVRVADGGKAIEVEIWRVPSASVGRLLTSVPPPLSLGHVSLVDGSLVLGFLCEAYAADGGTDISASGGWRAYRRAVTPV
jgi:allophanate hydrolase